MHYKQLTACGVAVAAALASGSVLAAPTVSWKQPYNGKTVSGTLSGGSCEATGSNIRYVRFYVDNTQVSIDGGSPWNCSIDTTKLKNGTHSLKVQAHDNSGAYRSQTVSVNVQNGTTTPPPTSSTGPTIAFTAPAEGGTLTGNVQGPPNCVVQGSNIARVMFYLNGVWTNTDGNLDNGLGCWIDTTKYPNGSYTVKAVAYDSSGRTATASRSVRIQNGTTSSGAPSVSITSPAAGATLKGDATCAASASDTGGSIARVSFYIDNKSISSDTASPYTCAFNTQSLANGTHTLLAIATDNSGLTSSAQRSFNVSNTDSTPDDPAPSTGLIDAADIFGQAQASVPFSGQSGYNTQVINTYLQANQIPESGIHGSTLPNGETLRLGKVADPRDSSKKALAFQLAPNDPLTSGSHRAEIRLAGGLANDKVYWAAFRHYVADWGSFSTSDTAMIAMQIHGGNVAGLSPAVAIYSRGGRNFWIDARGSTSSTPNQTNSVSVRSPERPIQFGRWVDFVVRFKLNTSGNGFVQVWMDGTQIWDFKGTVGYNTGSERPYVKFGYYNWTSFTTPRKVLLKSPVIVADPTGSKYTQDTLRQYVNSK
jgi:hypothetical protein